MSVLINSRAALSVGLLTTMQRGSNLNPAGARVSGCHPREPSQAAFAVSNAKRRSVTLSRAGSREPRRYSNSALLLNGPRVSHALAALSRLSSKGTPARSTFPGVLTQPDAGTFPEVCHV